MADFFHTASENAPESVQGPANAPEAVSIDKTHPIVPADAPEAVSIDKTHPVVPADAPETVPADDFPGGASGPASANGYPNAYGTISPGAYGTVSPGASGSASTNGYPGGPSGPVSSAIFHSASDGPVRPKKSAAARKRRRRIIRTIVILLLLGGAGFAAYRFFFAGRSAASESIVLTDVVQYGAITAKVEGSGLTRAKNSEVMMIPANGTVQEVMVEEGDTVSAGQPLFIIDSEEARKAVTDAEAGVTAAQETVDRAREGVRTAEEGVRTAEEGVRTAEEAVRSAEESVTTAEEGITTAQEGVVSAQDRVKTARESVTSAQDRVKSAQENVDSAVKRLNTSREDLQKVRDKIADLDIKAEWDGKLTQTAKLNVGDEVASGTVVAVLADDATLRLSQWYSYGYAGEIEPGQRAEVSIPFLMSTVEGRVEKVYTNRRTTTEGYQFFSVDILIDNAGALAAGTEAKAVIFTDGETAYPNDELGKLEYSRTKEIKTTVSGELLFTDMVDDLPVRAGQILARLSEDDLNEEIEAAEKVVEDRLKEVEDAQKSVTDAEKGVEDAQKSVTDAEKGVEDAQKEVTRAERAVEDRRKGVTDAQRGVETARRGVTDAQKGVTDAEKIVEDRLKDVDEARKKVDDALENLAKCNAVSPIDGKVVGLDLTTGADATSGRAAMTISDMTSIVVNATVDERNMGYIKKGMMVELDQWGTPAIGIVDSISLSSTVNNGVATYPMVISVDNADESLQINSNIRYSLVASQNDHCLIVPVQCVRTASTEDGESVTVVYVGEERPDNALDGVSVDDMVPEDFWPVEVEIGIQDSYNVEIRSGLTEGQTVFTQMQSSMMW